MYADKTYLREKKQPSALISMIRFNGSILELLKTSFTKTQLNIELTRISKKMLICYNTYIVTCKI